MIIPRLISFFESIQACLVKPEDLFSLAHSSRLFEKVAAPKNMKSLDYVGHVHTTVSKLWSAFKRIMALNDLKSFKHLIIIVTFQLLLMTLLEDRVIDPLH